MKAHIKIAAIAAAILLSACSTATPTSAPAPAAKVAAPATATPARRGYEDPRNRQKMVACPPKLWVHSAGRWRC